MNIRIKSRTIYIFLYVVSVLLIVIGMVCLALDIHGQGDKENEVVLVTDADGTDEDRKDSMTRLEVYRDADAAVPSDPDHKVLFIYSYEHSFYSADPEWEGIKEVLYANNISCEMICMNSHRAFDEAEADALTEQVNRTTEKNGPFDAVILGDDNALTFAEEHRDELFPDMPMIFLGVNDISHAKEAAEDPYITGVAENIFIKEAIDLALDQQPDAESVVAIVDNTRTGIGERKDFYSYSSRYPELSFRALNTSLMTREDLGDALEELDTSCIVIYLEAANDLEGNYYTIENSSAFVADHTRVPVYRPASGGIGSGLTGGVTCDFETYGNIAADMCVEIFDGTPVSDIPMVNMTVGKYVFDGDYLDRFKLDRSLLPDGAEILNESENYWETNGHILVPVMMVMLGLILMLGTAISNGIRASRYASELSVSQTVLEQNLTYLEYSASHDDGTDLLNRSSMLAALTDRLARLPEDSPFTIIAVDVDDMKEINDTYGRKVGDEIIRVLASRLKEISDRYDGLTARCDGDEFIIALTERRVDDLSDSIVRRLQRSCHSSIDVGGVSVIPACSAGVYDSTASDGDVEMAVVRADIALTTAKRQGKNAVVLFRDEMQESLNHRNHIRKAMLEAFREDGYYMVFQPKVNVSDLKLSSFEALVRMKGQKISPGEFVPMAEQSGWISTLGRITTSRTLWQVARWIEQGLMPVPVSINYSPGQLTDEGYVPFLGSNMKRLGIPPSMIQIEITESLFIGNSGNALRLMTELHDLGVKLLLDDFGSGYSNLEYMSYLPLDYIKIDKTLIDTYLVNGKESFIGDIIAMSRKLGAKTIAEGVETREQYEMLRKFGCDEIQGYLFSRPLDADDAERFLTDPQFVLE